MTALTNIIENEILDHILRNETWAAPTTMYVGLAESDSEDEVDLASTDSFFETNTALASAGKEAIFNQPGQGDTLYNRTTFTAVLASGGTSNSTNLDFGTVFYPWTRFDLVELPGPIFVPFYHPITHIFFVDTSVHETGNVIMWSRLANPIHLIEDEAVIIPAGTVSVNAL